MNIIFMGGRQAGCIGLLTLKSLGHGIEAVCYDQMTKDLTRSLHINVHTTISEMEKYLCDADLIVSVHGREIVPSDYLERVPHGGINVHPCLWKYKGANPVFRAMIAEEPMFSVGVHRMTDKLDEGEVLVENFIPIPKGRTLVGIYNELYPLYWKSLIEAMEKVKQ
jgi:methionyl-tRNA formyltransferase